MVQVLIPSLPGICALLCGARRKAGSGAQKQGSQKRGPRLPDVQNVAQSFLFSEADVLGRPTVGSSSHAVHTRACFLSDSSVNPIVVTSCKTTHEIIHIQTAGALLGRGASAGRWQCQHRLTEPHAPVCPGPCFVHMAWWLTPCLSTGHLYFRPFPISTSACLRNAFDGVFKEIITIFFSMPSINGLKSF